MLALFLCVTWWKDFEQFRIRKAANSLRCCPLGTLSYCLGCLKQAGRCPQGYAGERERQSDGLSYLLVHLSRRLNSSSFELARKGNAKEIKKGGRCQPGEVGKEGRKGEAPLFIVITHWHCQPLGASNAGWCTVTDTGRAECVPPTWRGSSTAAPSTQPAGRNSNCTERPEFFPAPVANCCDDREPTQWAPWGFALRARPCLLCR